jgi:hypothetical protein
MLGCSEGVGTDAENSSDTRDESNQPEPHYPAIGSGCAIASMAPGRMP